MNVIATVALAIAVFAATNVDDIFVLVGFFADPRFGRRQVVAGQFLGIGFLVAVSFVAALVALVIPAAYVGLLGIAPIAIGFKKLWDGFAGDGGDQPTETRAAGRGLGNVLAVALVTVANGGDNIGVYTPIFANQAGWQTLVTVAVFAAMTLLWCAVAGWLVHHPTLGKPIRHYGHRVLPLVLIGLGALILYEAGSFELMRVWL